MVVEPTFEEIISKQIKNFGKETKESFLRVYDEDNKKTEPVWISGWKMFDESILSLKSGWGIVGAVENAGKSNFNNCLFMAILDHTKNSRVIQCIYDDTQETAIHQLAAARGKVPMDDISSPFLLDEDDPKRAQRARAYKELVEQYGDRLEIIDGASWGDRGSYLNYLEEYLTKVREAFPNDKLWINIDAIDDILVPDCKDDNEALKKISRRLKALSNKLGATSPCFILGIKHFNKGNRGRGSSMEAFKGVSGQGYDCKLALILYSEMGELGNQAQIYFNPDPLDYTKRNPVVELTFKKNKVGKNKGNTMFFLQWPECYLCVPCTDKQQKAYSDLVSDSYGLKK